MCTVELTSCVALFVHGDPRFFRQVRPVLPHGYGPWTVAVVSSLVWLAALGAAIWQKRQLALGMLLAIPASFVLLLLKIEAAGAFPISDRFLYLTVIFAAVLVVGLIDKLAPRKATIVIGLALTVVAGLQARARVLVFEDDLSLYRAAVEAEPDNLWPVTPDESQHRKRSLYLLNRRTVRLPMLANFDQPDTMTSCAVRTSSTHALQALSLLNSDFIQAQAAAFAERLESDCGQDRECAVKRGYELTLARAPKDDELDSAVSFLGAADSKLADFCLALLNRNEFVYRP